MQFEVEVRLTVKVDGKNLKKNLFPLPARNRFNLRGSTTTEATDENVVENSASTTQRAAARLRPSFQLRTRGRPTPSATNAENENGSAEQASTDERSEEKVEEKPAPTRPSRLA